MDPVGEHQAITDPELVSSHGRPIVLSEALCAQAQPEPDALPAPDAAPAEQQPPEDAPPQPAAAQEQQPAAAHATAQPPAECTEDPAPEPAETAEPTPQHQPAQRSGGPQWAWEPRARGEVGRLGPEGGQELKALWSGPVSRLDGWDVMVTNPPCFDFR